MSNLKKSIDQKPQSQEARGVFVDADVNRELNKVPLASAIDKMNLDYYEKVLSKEEMDALYKQDESTKHAYDHYMELYKKQPEKMKATFGSGPYGFTKFREETQRVTDFTKHQLTFTNPFEINKATAELISSNGFVLDN